MKRPSRNDLCWCGSGKKYKKCHMEEDKKLYVYEEQGFIIPNLNIIKTPEQIEGIRKSGKITNEILDMVGERIKVGVTTNEIDDWVSEYTIKSGAIAAPLNYGGFPKSVCTSINDVICHGIPEDRPLKNGDIINVDVSTILNGYYSDASRMFVVGEASENAVKLVEAAKEALYIGINEVKPYGDLNSVGIAIENYCNKLGYSVVRDLGGHGIGLKFHEEPHVDHFARSGKGVLLLPGMVFTIEPMINEGSYKCVTLEDDWTVVTKDGSLSAQWEHTILVTESGVEILV
ncbi:methionyl aminopeptidase [Clostridium magnum]|uniref:Methionine aminopeptidase n=1 Tax=Clostridium magnum DSM 2767 TaxID=1121326 RepID=A0A161X5S6_9CLOT|nr:methionyl aminopeptidase [Clostridium magnum]KZL89326.1 methionine aminopeptidase [Clostridium magnum DSM 2767]SHJ08809.1 methionine aminopeptidase, type I [Clostridium magnum DSM 2767]